MSHYPFVIFRWWKSIVALTGKGRRMDSNKRQIGLLLLLMLLLLMAMAHSIFRSESVDDGAEVAEINQWAVDPFFTPLILWSQSSVK